MNIMIPLDEDKVSVCPTFGRAPFFLLHNTDTNQSDCLANPAADAQGGAGIKAAQFVADSGAQVLITPRCGENAAQVFQAAQGKIYNSQGTSAQENLAAMAAGTLEPLTHFHGGYHGIR